MDRILSAIVVVIVFVSAVYMARLTNSRPVLASEPTSNEINEDQRTVEEIIAAAKQAGANAEKLAKLIVAGEKSAAERMIGQDINIGGKPVERNRDAWTIKSHLGINAKAQNLQGKHDPNVKLEGDACAMWGKLRSIDMKSKTITLQDDVELIYVEWMPALHQGEK